MRSGQLGAGIPGEIFLWCSTTSPPALESLRHRGWQDDIHDADDIFNCAAIVQVLALHLLFSREFVENSHRGQSVAVVIKQTLCLCRGELVDSVSVAPSKGHSE